VEMNEGNDFMELLELQGNLEMVTKSELLDQARRHGASVSDRQLVSFAAEGLIPKSARIGSRGGAYPQLVVDELVFISRFRQRGMTVQGIKELLPLWRYMQRATRDREVSLSEFERIARANITMAEAWFAVPAVLQETLPCPSCSHERLNEIAFVCKDGSVMKVSPSEVVSIGFIMGTLDEKTGRATPRLPMRLAIPQEDEGFNPSSIILGVPNGVELERRHLGESVPPETDVDRLETVRQVATEVVSGDETE